MATATVSVVASLAAVAVWGAPSRALGGSASGGDGGTPTSGVSHGRSSSSSIFPASSSRHALHAHSLSTPCTVSATACPEAQAQLDGSYQNHACLENTAAANDVLAKAQAEMDKFVAAGCCTPETQPELREALLDLVKMDTCAETTMASRRLAVAVDEDGMAVNARAEAAMEARRTTTTIGGAAASMSASGSASGGTGGGAGSATPPAADHQTIIDLPFPSLCCTTHDPYMGICCDRFCHTLAELFGALYSYEDCCGVPLYNPLRADPACPTQKSPVYKCPVG